MRTKWIAVKSANLGSYKAVRQNVLMSPGVYEVTLAGKYGEIWQNGEHYKAVITNSHVASRYGYSASRGEERVISFQNQDLDLWMTRLKISKHFRPSQARYANAFGRPVAASAQRVIDTASP